MQSERGLDEALRCGRGRAWAMLSVSLDVVGVGGTVASNKNDAILRGARPGEREARGGATGPPKVGRSRVGRLQRRSI